jgi:hypothetical protein
VRPALAAAAAVLHQGGCGGSGDSATGSGELVWVKPPQLIVPPDLPRDRILTGTLRNQALRQVKSKARDVELRDSSGNRVSASVAFVSSYLHGLYPPTREPQLPDSELRRLGRLATIDPGKTTPIVVSWRLPRGAHQPVRVIISGDSLPIPAKPHQVRASD